MRQTLLPAMLREFELFSSRFAYPLALIRGVLRTSASKTSSAPMPASSRRTQPCKSYIPQQYGVEYILMLLQCSRIDRKPHFLQFGAVQRIHHVRRNAFHGYTGKLLAFEPHDFAMYRARVDSPGHFNSARAAKSFKNTPHLLYQKCGTRIPHRSRTHRPNSLLGQGKAPQGIPPPYPEDP